MTYRPHLDGLRGVAILLVIATHTFPYSPFPGWLGVDVFFVLSGYLITSLLLAELEDSGGLRLGRFYARRVGRLYPALLLMLVVVAPLAIAMGGVSYLVRAAVSASYLANYAMVYGHTLEPLSHTWSLAVEEQFYVVWPLLMLAAYRWGGRRLVLAVAGAGAVAASTWLVVGFSTAMDGARTDMRGGGLMLGCALAASRGQWPKWAGWVGLGLLGVVLWSGWQITGPPGTLYMIATGVAAGLMVASPPNLLGFAPLTALGRLSYSLYLWHYPLLDLARGHPGMTPVALAASVLLALLSYRLVETPVRRWVARRTSLRDAEVVEPAHGVRTESEQPALGVGVVVGAVSR